MTFKEIYEQAIQWWGEKIDISDAMIIEKKSSQNKFFNTKDSENFYSQQLSECFKQALEKSKNVGVLQEVMTWSIYDSINKKAAGLFHVNIKDLNPKDIDQVELERLFFKQLEDDGYLKELDNFNR